MKLDIEFTDGVIPTGVTLLEAIAIVKCLDENGEVTWFQISTPDLNLMESFGMVMAAVVVKANSVNEGFRPSDDDESED